MASSVRSGTRQSSLDSERSTFSIRPSSVQVDMLYGHTVSPIIEGVLYLSDQQAPVDSNLLNYLCITHIVNASNESVPNKFPESYHYYNVNVEDNNADDLLPHFDAVYDFLCDTIIEPTKTKSAAEIIDDMSHSTSTIVTAIIEAALENVETAKHNHADELHSKLKYPAVVSETDESIAMGTNALHFQEQPVKVILFHCRMGISRSSTLLIAYVMKWHNITLKEAYRLVKQKRPKINPSPVFSEALVRYENQLFPDLSSSSMTAYQVCGTAKLSISSRQNDKDNISIGSATTTGRSRGNTTLVPINEQESSNVPDSMSKKACCCCIM